MGYQKLAQALNDSVKMYTPDVLYPRECLIVGINEDDTLKIIVNIGENIYLDEVRYIGIPKTNTTGLFIPLNNNYDEGYCICYNETTESLTENVIINNINNPTTEKVNEVNDSEEETSEEITNEVSEETQSNINYDRRYAKINHTHTENVGTIEDLKTLIKNTKEGNILSLNENFKNERYGNIIINKRITIDGNGHSIENISFTCDADEIELNNITFFNVTTNRVNGGALQLNGQKISINNCIFYNNIINGTSVYEGGAISVNSSSIETKITDCYFIDNFCSNNGGAIRWVANNGVLIGCKFIGNSATNSGGAIKWLGTDGFIRNCLFKDNKASTGKDILTSDDGLLCIGNVFLNDDTITGTERIYDYITEYDKEEIEHQIYSSFGRNILPNTKDMVLSNNNIKVTYADETFRNNKVVYFDDETVSSNGYRDWYYDISVGEFDYDDEFTLSFWVKSTENVSDKVKVYFDGGTNYTKVKVIDTNGYDYVDEFNDGRTSFEIDTNWKKCYVTWKLNSTGNLTVYKRLRIRIYDGVEVFLSSPKLERGNVYTDWTPNPNDNLYDRIPINVSASNPNIDLNDYIESGVYYQPNNTNSQYVTNKPTNDNLAFSLFVEKQTDNGVKQTFTYYDYPKTSRMFVRIKHYSSDNWTKWEEIQFKGMIDGGSNLLNVASYFQSGGNLMEDGGLHNGHRAVHIDNLDKTSSQYTQIHWTLPLNFHNYNEIYTLSFWAKGTNGKNITTYFGGESGYVTVKRINTNSTVTDWETSFNDGATHFSLSDDWQHFYVTYKLNSTGDLTKRKQPIIRVWGKSEAYISSPKLEKGYNVYDWTPSVLNAEPIYPNMDLNDFTMKGEYRCPLTAWATKIENVPKNCQVAFNLKVEPTIDNGCIQTFSSYLPYKTLIFKRSMYNNDWSNWDLSITEPYICSVTDENYGTGTNGFGKLFKIYLNNTWYDSPISFEINQRGLHRPIKCYLKFKNENSKNPTIEYFTYDGQDKDIYICNEEVGYYTVYVRKTWDRDFIEVKNFNFNERYSTIQQRARIYAINEQVSSVPYKSSSNYNNGNNDKKAVNVVKIESNNDITLSNNLTVNGDFSSGNIIDKLSTSSTDEEIPSAKAVYDEFKVINWLNEYSWETYYDNNIKPTINNDEIVMNKGNYCYLKYEFTHNKCYEMEFDFICTDNRNTGLIIGGNKTLDNWYEIVVSVNNIRIYERKNGTDTLITTFYNTFFNYDVNKIKMIRNNDYLNLYVNDELMYEFEFKDYHNIIGMGNIGDGLVYSFVSIKNIKIYNTSKTYTYKKVEIDKKCKNRWGFWGQYQGMQSLTNTNVVLSNTDELYFGGYVYTYYDGEGYDEPIELTLKLTNNVSVYVSKNRDDLYNLYDEDKLTYNVSKNFTLDAKESVYVLVRDKNGTAMNTYTANINYEVKDIVRDTINNIVDIIYPVGAIYMSVNNVNPNVLFGGRWEQLKDRFLLGSGDVYTGGATGGSANAVVVKHNHTQNAHNHTASENGKRSFLTAPTGSSWNEIAGGNISGSGYHYVATQDTSNYNVWVAQSANKTATNQESGVDGTGKNMPPYLTVYMWKRIG